MIVRTGFLKVVGLLVLGIFLLSACKATPRPDWPTYGGDPGGSRYSAFDQINRENVRTLEVA